VINPNSEEKIKKNIRNKIIYNSDNKKEMHLIMGCEK